MTFGKRLVKAREQANLKQNQLANLLGITPSRLNYWEKDKREPDILMLKKISQVLQISADYLIGNDFNDTTENNEKTVCQKYKSVIDNLNQLNNQGIEKTESYTDDLVMSGKYRKSADNPKNQ